jgi:hypothetical protein
MLMKMRTIQKTHWFFYVFCLLLVLMGGIQPPASSNQSNDRFSPNSLVKKRINDLQNIGLQIYDAIIARDVSTILKFIDRKEGIRWGPDSSKSYEEVEKDLRSRKGQLYCLLFGCAGRTRKSVREFFSEVKRPDLRVEVRVLRHEGPDDLYVEVIYDWPGKPPDLWVTDLPNPELKWLHGGWKFESVFME